MHGKPCLSCIAGLFSCAALAQAPPIDLAQPPGDAHHFLIESASAKHGDSWSWTSADGARLSRESLNLGGEVWDSESTGVTGSSGSPSKIDIRGVSPRGDLTESFGILNGRAQWKSPVDASSARYQGNAFYLPWSGLIDFNAWLLERLLASPDKSLTLLPAGRSHATLLGHLEIGTGTAAAQVLTLWGISGLDTAPTPMWTDAQGKFFAQTAAVGWLPADYAGEQQHLQQAETTAMAVQSASLAKELRGTESAPVAFVDVRLFDAEHVAFVTHQTVVVDQGVISAVGPAASVKAPPGAKIISGRGMTLIPGLWDCHLHLRDDYSGLRELSLGVTSVCDPGNVDALTLDRRVRAAAGQLLFPRVYAAELIDGHGPYSAPYGIIAASQVEALELVNKAKADGFGAVDFYGTFNPDWLPASVAEVHRLGMYVQGPVPAGIQPLDAINDG